MALQEDMVQSRSIECNIRCWDFENISKVLPLFKFESSLQKRIVTYQHMSTTASHQSQQEQKDALIESQQVENDTIKVLHTEKLTASESTVMEQIITHSLLSFPFPREEYEDTAHYLFSRITSATSVLCSNQPRRTLNLPCSPWPY